MYESAQKLDLVNYYGKNLTFKTGGVDAGYGSELIKLIESDIISCDWMSGRTYDFDSIQQALDDFEAKKHLKITITFQ